MTATKLTTSVTIAHHTLPSGVPARIVERRHTDGTVKRIIEAFHDSYMPTTIASATKHVVSGRWLMAVISVYKFNSLSVPEAHDLIACLAIAAQEADALDKECVPGNMV